MLKKIYFLREFANLFYEVCFATLIAMVARELITRKPFHLIFIGMIFALFFLSHLIREKSNTIWQALFLHIGLLIISIFVPMDSLYFLFVGFLITYLFIASSIYFRNNKVITVSSINAWPVFGGCILMYIIGYAQKSEYVMNLSYIGVVILLITYLVINYLNGIVAYMNTYDDVSNVPVKKIIKSSSLTASLVVVTAFVAMFFSGNKGINFIFDKLANILKWIGYYIGTAIVKILRFLERFNSDYEEIEQEKFDIPEPINDTGDFPWKMIVTIIAVIIIVMVLVQLIKLLFLPKDDGGDIVEDAKIDTDEVLNLKQKKFRKMSMEEKARYYYRQKILKHKNDITLTYSKTSENINQEVKDLAQKDLSEITKLYSDIRYGGKDVDKSVLKQMNNLRKQ